MLRERRWSMFIVEMVKFITPLLRDADTKIASDYGLVFKKVDTDKGYSLVYIITFRAYKAHGREERDYQTIFEVVRVDSGEGEHVSVLYNVVLPITDDILQSIGKKPFLEIKKDFEFKIAAMLATSAIKGE